MIEKIIAGLQNIVIWLKVTLPNILAHVMDQNNQAKEQKSSAKSEGCTLYPNPKY